MHAAGFKANKEQHAINDGAAHRPIGLGEKSAAQCVLKCRMTTSL
jgi:hypothetical protein